MYDIAVVGGGIIGAACAYTLSKYKLKIAVLEKKNDVCCGTTKANSAIIHAGYDPHPGTKMARLNVRGSEMAEGICKKLDVPYERIGSLVVAFSEEEAKPLSSFMKEAVQTELKALKFGIRKRFRQMSLSFPIRRFVLCMRRAPQ